MRLRYDSGTTSSQKLCKTYGDCEIKNLLRSSSRSTTIRHIVLEVSIPTQRIGNWRSGLSLARFSFKTVGISSRCAMGWVDREGRTRWRSWNSSARRSANVKLFTVGKIYLAVAFIGELWLLGKFHSCSISKKAWCLECKLRMLFGRTATEGNAKQVASVVPR